MKRKGQSYFGEQSRGYTISCILEYSFFNSAYIPNAELNKLFGTLYTY